VTEPISDRHVKLFDAVLAAATREPHPPTLNPKAVVQAWQAIKARLDLAERERDEAREQLRLANVDQANTEAERNALADLVEEVRVLIARHDHIKMIGEEEPLSCATCSALEMLSATPSLEAARLRREIVEAALDWHNPHVIRDCSMSSALRRSKRVEDAVDAYRAHQEGKA